MAIKDTMASIEGRGKLYIKITFVSEAFYGSNFSFYFGDAFLLHDNTPSGKYVFPVIASWGVFANQAMQAGDRPTTLGEVALLADVEVQGPGVFYKWPLYQWIQEMDWRNRDVEVYQWNAFESTQQVIWKGYVQAIGARKHSENGHVIEMTFAKTKKNLSVTTIGTVVSVANFAPAPIRSIGSMIPKAYGSFDQILHSWAHRNSPLMFGYPASGIQGIVIDENQATVATKIRFFQADGVTAYGTFAEPTAGDPETVGDLWVYDPGINSYGLVENGSYTPTSDTSKLEAVIKASPTVYFFIRPSEFGQTNAAAFTGLNNLIDDDPTNYLQSTATDASWAFLAPEATFNGRIVSATVFIDIDNMHATKTRRVQFGIWDPYKAGGAGWLNGRSRIVDIVAGTSRQIISFKDVNGRYVPQDCKNHTGSSTMAEFSAGRFITRSTGDTQEANLELRAMIVDLGGLNAGVDQVNLHHMSLMVEVIYPQLTKGLGNPNGKWWWPGPEWPNAKPWETWNEKYGWMRGKTRTQAEREVLAQVVGTMFFIRGVPQLDTGAGKYTDSASTPITKVPDIAYHMLDTIGETVEATPSAFGSFDEARGTGTVLALIDNTAITFGPNKLTVGQGLDELTRRFPIFFDKGEDGKWRAFCDEMNPKVERSFRSNVDPIYITKDDVELESLEINEIPWEEIQNSVLFKYGNGFPDREAAAQYAYENPLSKKWFGVKDQLVVEEPWVVQSNLSSATNGGAQAMAEWYGRRTARPRLMVKAALTQKFFDLSVGNVLELKGLEDEGVPCTAFRNNLIDYMFPSSSSGTDAADGGAFIAGAGTSELYIGLSKQVSGLTFYVNVASGYTTVASAWEYVTLGGSWLSFSNVVNADALKSTGTQSVSWTRPSAHNWYKQELTIGGAARGPCYWIRMKYSTATAAGSQLSRTNVSNGWEGRRFVVMKVSRDLGARGRYPKVMTTLMEVM